MGVLQMPQELGPAGVRNPRMPISMLVLSAAPEGPALRASNIKGTPGSCFPHPFGHHPSSIHSLKGGCGFALG